MPLKQEVSHVLVTTPMDHSPGCRLLQAETGAPTYAYGPHGAGKVEQGAGRGGRRYDFKPDHL